MKKSNKKGFTIVELVIVIAVIAILAAVLIPTFSNLIKKANESADQQVIRNMNTILATYTESEKEISDVMAYLRSNGYSYEKMVANAKGYHYCYAKSTNQMYLLNEKNEIVYPKKANVTLADLWAAYDDNAASIIPGINNYFATQTVNTQAAFNEAFATGTFVLDLNNNLCNVTGKDNVTVINGFVTKSGFAAGSEVIAVAASNDTNTAKATNDESKITKVTYTNVLNPAGRGTNRIGDKSAALYDATEYADTLTIEYVNCVFTKQLDLLQDGGAVNVTFTNCTFVNTSAFAVVLQPGVKDQETGSYDTAYGGPGKASVVTFNGCEFVNCGRGIHVSDWENTTVNVNDCTFALKTSSDAYNCVQISCYATDAELANVKINFTNNTVASAYGVLYVHDEMTGPKDINTFKGILNFSGNTYAEGVVKVTDRGDYGATNHWLNNNKEAMDQLAGLIK